LDQAGAHLTVELVENPKGQKGGIALWAPGTPAGCCFLLEGINARSPALQRRLEELNRKAKARGLGGLPYNAFRLRYRLESLPRLLAHGLPLTLRLRSGRLFPEIVTGDLTRVPGACVVAIQRRGQVIHDFKAPQDVCDGAALILQQDRDPAFRRWAHRYGRVRSGP